MNSFNYLNSFIIDSLVTWFSCQKTRKLAGLPVDTPDIRRWRFGLVVAGESAGPSSDGHPAADCKFARPKSAASQQSSVPKLLVAGLQELLVMLRGSQNGGSSQMGALGDRNGLEVAGGKKA